MPTRRRQPRRPTAGRGSGAASPAASRRRDRTPEPRPAWAGSAGPFGVRDRLERFLLRLVEVPELALQHVILRPGARLFDARRVVVDAHDDQRGVALVEQRADLLGLAAAGAMRQVPEPCAYAGARARHAGDREAGK